MQPSCGQGYCLGKRCGICGPQYDIGLHQPQSAWPLIRDHGNCSPIIPEIHLAGYQLESHTQSQQMCSVFITHVRKALFCPHVWSVGLCCHFQPRNRVQSKPAPWTAHTAWCFNPQVRDCCKQPFALPNMTLNSQERQSSVAQWLTPSTQLTDSTSVHQQLLVAVSEQASSKLHNCTTQSLPLF